MVGIYIMELFDNNRENGGFFDEKSLGDLLQNFEEDKTGLIPRLSVGEKDLKIEGAAVIKDYELQGWLDERQLKGLLWILKKDYRLEISAPYDDYYIAYNVSESNTKIEFLGDNEEIICKVLVEVEGNIDEFILDENIFELETIRKLEKVIKRN